MDDKRLHQLSSDFLHKFVKYWDGLSQDRKKWYFYGDDIEDDDIKITSDEFIEKMPVRMSLKVVRLDLSMPPHVYAQVSSGPATVRMMAFRLVTGELEWNEENVASLAETYKKICKELWHELA